MLSLRLALRALRWRGATPTTVFMVALIGITVGPILAPAAGDVRLGATPVRVGELAMRRRIAVVLQGYGLVTALTGRKNIAITLQARGPGRVAAPSARHRRH